MRVLAPWLLWLVVCLPIPAGAQTAQPTANDPVANKRAVHLADQLRCLVCQNQTIADSNAELAVDLRRQIREQIAQGRSDAEIVSFMVQRYGDFVLYKPPVKATTLLLWFGPALLLLVGMLALLRNLRGRAKRDSPHALNDEERARARGLLDGSGGKDAA